jgi:hypothetical protein
MKSLLTIIGAGVLLFWLLSGLESDARPMPRGWAKFRRDNLAAECVFCERRSHLELHHVVPVSRGGPELDPENVRTLCDWCHEVWGHFGSTRDGYNLDIDEDVKAFRQRVEWRSTGGREQVRDER